MKYKVTIKSVQTVHSIDGYWTNEDYINLLELLDYPDARSAAPTELKELLQMAVSDFEPSDAAETFLKYRLSEVLSDGQIQNLSHEMLQDKVAEEYPDTSLHYDLYCVNQLLFELYNGKFPNTEATIIKTILSPMTKGQQHTVNEEVALKAIRYGLKDSNLLTRLFEGQLDGNEEFGDAANVLWDLKDNGEDHFRLITSHYWIEKDDFVQEEFEAEIHFFENE